MFETGGKFYLWTRIYDSVYEITASTDLVEIISMIEGNGWSGFIFEVALIFLG